MRDITRTVLVFLIGFVLILLLSAFLAPWLASFLPFKFDRILRRCIMIGTLGLVAWVLRVRGKETLSRLGLKWGKPSLQVLGFGFLGGALLVVLMSGAQWALGARFWKLHETDLGHWIGFFFKAFGAGVLIGAIEEIFFRGFLFLTLKDLWETKASLVVTNLVYSLVHFFPKGKVFVEGAPTYIDSFRIYGAAFSNFDSSPERFLAIAGLFLFGLLLNFIFLGTGSLYPCVGTHAGAVFGLKLNRRFIPELSDKMNFWSGGKNLYDGVAGLLLLGVAAFLVARSLRIGGKLR
jgi:membrane protease YdiL (CAAX protease family)